MLREHIHVRQEPGRRRRWFEDEGLDLIVWFDEAGGVEGFQLCRNSEALTWRRQNGFTYGRIDEGDDTPLKNQTPVIVPNGAIPWSDVTENFKARSAPLEPLLRALILERLAAKT
ncbi:MAG: hypothetical protein JWM32_736 [Verrucomicrobia bacterium]|nr:hypothetical protein [Verrucomicrobiota bacterium]